MSRVLDASRKGSRMANLKVSEASKKSSCQSAGNCVATCLESSKPEREGALQAMLVGMAIHWRGVCKLIRKQVSSIRNRRDCLGKRNIAYTKFGIFGKEMAEILQAYLILPLLLVIVYFLPMILKNLL